MQPKLRALHDRLGQLKGKASLVDGYAEFSLDALLTNIVASSAIESKILNITAHVRHLTAVAAQAFPGTNFFIPSSSRG